MSRSGYSEDVENWSLIRWRGAVKSAIRGKRGQAFLREALTAFDAMPSKMLIGNSFKTAEGCVCTLGAVGVARNLDMSAVWDGDQEGVAALFGLPRAMACEIMWENDECGPYNETPEQRFQRMRSWIVSNLKSAEQSA